MIKKLTQKTEHTNQLGDRGKKEQQITLCIFCEYMQHQPAAINICVST